MPLTVAKTAGFCFGVRRTVDTVYEQLERIPSTSQRPLISTTTVLIGEFSFGRVSTAPSAAARSAFTQRDLC